MGYETHQRARAAWQKSPAVWMTLKKGEVLTAGPENVRPARLVSDHPSFAARGP